ncbi:tetratricopeptide repeat protein [Nostoc sp. CALU 546]|uniref:tetratricopeptide repeat protein n=1 Tax=Nostoc sp. CALU 546 TaxID=1867241 RepID=UPI003B66E8D6
MTEVTLHPECPFTHQTFELLEKFKNHSSEDFYSDHKEEFQEYIEKPLHQIYIHVIAQLPGQIIEKLDVQNATIEKFYHSSLLGYYLISKKTTNNFKYIKFFICIEKDDFRFGLLINEYSDARQKFIKNIQNKKIKEILLQHLNPIDDLYLRSESSTRISNLNRLSDWLRVVGSLKSATKNIQISKHLKPKTVLASSSEELVKNIKQTLERVFLLFLVATEDNPLPPLKRYILKEDLDEAIYLYNQGLILYEKAAYIDVVVAFNIAIQKAPNLGDAYNYRGKAKAKSGDINGAISDLNQLLLIQPKNAEGYDSRGNLYCKQDNYNEAIQDYSQAISINSNYALAYYHRGGAYLEFEMKLKAIVSQIFESVVQSSSLLWLIFGSKMLPLIVYFQSWDATQKIIEDLRIAVDLFEKEKDVENYEEAQRLLNTIHPDYSEPEFSIIYQKICSKKLQISKSVLRRYHLALKTRKFVILSGISGTGKTWLTKAYAEAIGAKYILVPVAPNWTTNEDLLGYFNPIDQNYHHTEFSHFLEQAAEEYKKAKADKRTPIPYHLVLDEMNLARVEYYFAKFLSVMEVRMREGETEIELAPGKKVLLPPNLYFIGTVNVDETTHNFADKIYDRAQMIELEINRDDLEKYLEEVEYREILMQIWDSLHEVAPFAFRTLSEIKAYVTESEVLEISWNDALDEQLLQKILPKLKGADERIGEALKVFIEIAKQHKFNLSLAKATKMRVTFEQHGFTSYF